MRFAPILAACAFAGTALAHREPNKHVRKMNPPKLERRLPTAAPTNSTPEYSQNRTSIIPETEKTKAFKVNGSAIPDVSFDVGESYAGLLPISNDTNSNSSELFFWFYPSANPEANDEILIVRKPQREHSL